MVIGQQLKNIRKDKDITLTEISKKTDLSIGFLSNLERDQTSPTIDVLHKICNALNITLNDILQQDSESQETKKTGNITTADENIVRKDDRKMLFQDNEKLLSYASMTKGETDFKVSSMTMKSNELYKFAEHDHDELGIVVSGSLEMQINDKSYFLYPGDKK